MPADKVVALIVVAGIGIGYGLYLLFRGPNVTQEVGLRQNPSPLNRRRRRRSSSSSLSSDGDSSPKTRRRSRRAISPPREIPPTPNNASDSGPRNRTTTRPEDIPNCFICQSAMTEGTIELSCGHTYHDECLTIWRHLVLKLKPQANLCPRC